MKISDGIEYAGVNDHALDLFEGQYRVPNGMSYNSYVIRDEECAVLDSVDSAFTGEWLSNVEKILAGRSPAYLVVSHMECDHSAGIGLFAEKYPGARIVASAAAFRMMAQFFGTDFAARRIVVKEGDELKLGRHTLRFVAAPMVHWPEVMMSYEGASGTLFSADAFGKFGALDADEEWDCEARRYYFGIVGKYGAQVQALLKKVSALDIKTICPLHGPVLTENLPHYTGLYNTWSRYDAETEGVFIACASAYGHTRKACRLLAEKLERAGVRVETVDLARCDMAECVENAFRYKETVFASVTYNGEVFPFMKTFIASLAERNFQRRRVAFIENGSWAPSAAKWMKEALSRCKDLDIIEQQVTIRGDMNEESGKSLDALCGELVRGLRGGAE